MNKKNSWKILQIKDLVKNEKYAVVDGPFGTQLHKREYVENGIPLIRVQNIAENSFFDENNLVYVSEKKFNQLNPDDILLAKTGSIGRVCFLPSKFKKGLLASSCAKISIDKKKIIPQFVEIFLSSHDGQKQIFKYAVGSTRKTINLTEINSIKIPVPSAPIQEKIVKAIHKVRTLINKQKFSNELSDKLNSSYFNETFGVFSPSNKLKKVELKELVDGKPQNGLFKKNNLYGTGTKIVWVEHISKNCILDSSNLKKVKLSRNEIIKYHLDKNDIVVTRSSHLGKQGVGIMNVVKDSNEDVTFESHIMRLKLKTKLVNPFYLCSYFNTIYGRALIEQLATQATMSTINQPSLLSLQVFLPPIELQKKFENFILKVFENNNRHIVTEAFLKKLRISALSFFFKDKINF